MRLDFSMQISDIMGTAKNRQESLRVGNEEFFSTHAFHTRKWIAKRPLLHNSLNILEGKTSRPRDVEIFHDFMFSPKQLERLKKKEKRRMNYFYKGKCFSRCKKVGKIQFFFSLFATAHLNLSMSKSIKR